MQKPQNKYKKIDFVNLGEIISFAHHFSTTGKARMAELVDLSADRQARFKIY